MIPPLKVIDAVLRRRGGDGGMSPGASWEPFTVAEAEYRELVGVLLALDLAEATKQARFVKPSLREDSSLHHHSDLIAWSRAAKEKHGASQW